MADREVTSTGKDKDKKKITSLCNSKASWSPRSKKDAIDDIEAGTHSYYVQWTNTERTEVRVVNDPDGKYLRTDRDNTTRNNLLDLPDC